MVSQWKVARLFKSDILGSYGDALYVNGNLVHLYIKYIRKQNIEYSITFLVNF